MDINGKGKRESRVSSQSMEIIKVFIFHTCHKKDLTEDINILYPRGRKGEFEIEGKAICEKCGFDYVDAVFDVLQSCKKGECSL